MMKKAAFIDMTRTFIRRRTSPMYSSKIAKNSLLPYLSIDSRASLGLYYRIKLLFQTVKTL